ncbi:DUF1489 domain-containing protein [Rhodopseudomonas pseudopalustris]|uniref:DUF1489 family protein n=1 Tax=Rhodopseudomonas pseudopalustris TaxID=1513892 RepID=UPI003F987F84
MTLHLIKLAVGAESTKDLTDWIAERTRAAKARGLPPYYAHVTRMTPKREDELLAGGSLYWVIRGAISARQQLVAIEPFRDGEGVSRCRLLLAPEVVAVAPRPMRPFQGWRYLKASDAPPDLSKSEADGLAAMPEEMRRELRELGLL